MIIDFNSDIKNYEKNVLKNREKIKWNCPCCGANGSYHRHGTYNRNLIFFDNGGLKEIKLSIQRLKCNKCKHTQSIIPWDIIPYSIYSVKTIFLFYYIRKLEEKSIFMMSKKLSISYQILYYYIKVIHLYVRKIVFLLRYIYSIFINESIIEILLLYYKEICFIYLLFYEKPFLLNRSTTNKYKLFYEY